MRECSSWCLAAVVVGVVGPVALAQWTFTNLHPTGAAESAAMGVSHRPGGTVRVVGYAGVGANYHAALWGTTAATFVDLHPVTTAGPNSIAHATDGVQQVGVVFSSSPIGAASIWTGTAASSQCDAGRSVWHRGRDLRRGGECAGGRDHNGRDGHFATGDIVECSGGPSQPGRHGVARDRRHLARGLQRWAGVPIPSAVNAGLRAWFECRRHLTAPGRDALIVGGGCERCAASRLVPDQPVQ